MFAHPIGMVSCRDVWPVDLGVPVAVVRGAQLPHPPRHHGAGGHPAGLRRAAPPGQDLPRVRLDRGQGEAAGPILPEHGQYNACLAK